MAGTYVYVIRAGEKYYVGTTRDVAQRVQEHRSGNGAAWTKSWPLVSRLNLVLEDSTRYEAEAEARGEETKKTATLCYIHGLDNVRGAQFCLVSPTLTEKEQWCITVGHALKVNYEKVKKDLLGQHINIGLPDSPSTGQHSSSPRDPGLPELPHFEHKKTPPVKAQASLHIRKKPNFGCLRCGRSNHTLEACFAKIDVDGHLLDYDDNRFARDNEEDEGESENDNDETCHCCGRTGHWALDCYAKTDVLGKRLRQ